MVRAPRIALLAGLAALGCYPPIDDLVTGEPPPDTSRSCGEPGEWLGTPVARFEDTAFPARTGASHAVDPGGDLQAAIDAALPGDEIVVQAGAEYAGPLSLPHKGDDTATIVIRSSALSELAEGRTVALEDAPRLATLLGSETDPALVVEERASGWRLAGIELRPPAGVAAATLAIVGSSASTLAEALPDRIVFDRCLVRGDPALGAGGGIDLHTRGAAILDSRITDIHAGIEPRGIAIDNAPGPILIHNSVVEAAFQNVAIGERTPGAPELLPQDISICRSVLAKPEAWQGAGHPTKSLLEIGRGRRVLVSGTRIERSWPDVHPGFAIVIEDEGMDAGMPTEDLSFVDVRMRDVRIAFEVETAGVPGSIARVLIENSELTGVGDRGARVLGGGVQALTWVHVTAVVGGALLDGGGTVNPDLVLRDGLFDPGLYGIRADGQGSGIDALDAQYAPWTVAGNVFVGADAGSYPQENFFPPTMFEAGVVDAAAGNYRLAPNGPYSGKATDGTDPGADIDRLEAALPAP